MKTPPSSSAAPTPSPTPTPSPASAAASTPPHRDHLILTREVSSLTKEIARLKDMDFMQVFNHPLKFLWYSFLKGLMIGFGSVLGASVLVALFIYMLSKIQLVPIVGDFVQDLINQIQSEQYNKYGKPPTQILTP